MQNFNAPPGLCGCGCGAQTAIAKQTDNRRGWINGQPILFIPGHNAKGVIHPRWTGRPVKNNGYLRIWQPEHPKAIHSRVREHVLIAEKALGKPLPPGAIVHHVDENKANNTNSNLVICQDTGYHRILHARMKALAVCGNANWARCVYCKQYDHPLRLSRHERKYRFYHRTCAASYQYERIHKKGI